jgi:hypothetical protein
LYILRSFGFRIGRRGVGGGPIRDIVNDRGVGGGVWGGAKNYANENRFAAAVTVKTERATTGNNNNNNNNNKR